MLREFNTPFPALDILSRVKISEETRVKLLLRPSRPNRHSQKIPSHSESTPPSHQHITCSAEFFT